MALDAPDALPQRKEAEAHWTGGWVGLRTGINIWENRRILLLPGIKIQNCLLLLSVPLPFLKVTIFSTSLTCVSPLTLYSAPPSIFGRFHLHDIAMVPLTVLSISLKEPGRWNDWWVKNWNEFVMQHLWANQGTTLAFDWGNNVKKLVKYSWCQIQNSNQAIPPPPKL